MNKIFVIAIVFAVSGCATAERFNQAAETITDALIKKVEFANDKAMTGLDKSLVLLERKKARLKKSRCKMPFTALRRYALRGEPESKTVEQDCKLVINQRNAVAE